MANRPGPAPAGDAPARTPREALRRHWPLYLMEASELALFMLAACACTVWLYGAGSAWSAIVQNAWLRRFLMGACMGLTAVAIIHSPMGKRSGAHFNPAITLAYLLLGKISGSDALFYVLFQFLGGAAGVGVAALCFGPRLAQPDVRYAITVPGAFGVTGAFAAELFMAFVLFSFVLFTSNRPKLARFTSYVVGALIMIYILLFAPVSGFSINPARTVASALFAHVWTAVWLYFVAPLAGMFAAARIYLRSHGRDRILCAKLHPAQDLPCPFHCCFPGHGRRDANAHLYP